MICIHSNKCNLGISMINYRELWLPEKETQLEMCLEQAYKRMESGRVKRSVRAKPFFVHCWKPEWMRDVQKNSRGFVCF